MRIARLAAAFALIAGLVGCGFFTSDLSPDELARLATRDKQEIYFKGQAAPAKKFAATVGPVQGKICQTALLSSVAEYQALQAMWANAQAKKATAVVDAECGSAPFLTPAAGSYCWPGYACTGTGVK